MWHKIQRHDPCTDPYLLQKFHDVAATVSHNNKQTHTTEMNTSPSVLMESHE